MQWIPGHYPDLADFLAKVGASLDPSTILMSLSPLISSKRLSLYTSWRHSVKSGLFQHQIPPLSPEELTLPRSARCALSLVYAATGTALSLALISTGLVEQRLLHAATIYFMQLLNHRTFLISC